MNLLSSHIFRGCKEKISFFLILLLFIFLCFYFPVTHANAAVFTAFGQKVFQRENGAAVTEEVLFSIPVSGSGYTFNIYNGGLEDHEVTGENVSSSTIYLNGQLIAGPSNFNQNVNLLSVPVTLQEENDLTVLLKGKPGGVVTIEITGEDDDLPSITATLDKQPNVNDWFDSDVTVTFECSDQTSGIASCSDSVLVSGEGFAQEVTGEAIDNAGNTQTVSVIVNVDKTSPAIAIESPANNQVLSEVSVIRVNTADNLALDTSSIQLVLDGASLLASCEFEANIATCSTSQPISAGNHLLTASIMDMAGNQSSDQAEFSINSLQLSIDSHFDGEFVDTDTVAIKGSFEAPVNSGITVNGVVALTYEGEFVASDIKLLEGSNIVTVILETVSGDTVEKTVVLESSGKSPLTELKIEPSTGVAPLNSTFVLEYFGTDEVQTIEVDYEGDGVFDLQQPFDESITFTYSQPGLYNPHAKLITASGDSITTFSYVLVLDESATDQMLRDIFQAMNDELIAGNKETALKYWTHGKREKYGVVFDELMPHMAQIVSTYSELQKSFIAGTYAEYAIARTIEGEDRLFMVYFMKDAVGVWRIFSM